jgi:Sulfotransferase family
MIIEEAKKISPQNYITLTYESLVSNPEKSMEDVCQFLNLPYDNNMVQNHQSGMYSNFNSNTKEGFRKVHQNVFNPITPAHIDEWEGKIPAQELFQVESVAGKFGEITYGYKLTHPEKMTNSLEGHFMMDFKYKGIRALYRQALSHLWLYYKIKHYVWRNF